MFSTQALGDSPLSTGLGAVSQRPVSLVNVQFMRFDCIAIIMGQIHLRYTRITMLNSDCVHHSGSLKYTLVCECSPWYMVCVYYWAVMLVLHVFIYFLGDVSFRSKLIDLWVCLNGKEGHMVQ